MEKLAQKRGDQSIFPAPLDGETVEIDPPSLQWVGEPDVMKYRIVLRTASGKILVNHETSKNYLWLHKPLGPGEFVWNVFANDKERGEWRFTVPENARPFVVPTARELLNALPAEHPRHYLRQGDQEELRQRYADKIEILKRNIAMALEQGFMPYPNYYRPDGWVDGRHVLDVEREYLDRNLVACALGYFLLGDKAAGAYAKEAVLRVCEWNPAGPMSVNGKYGDEAALSVCRSLPFSVDLTWDLYDERERDWIQDTLLGHGRQIMARAIRHNFHCKPGQSHIGRMPGYLGEIAIVLAKEAPAEAERFLDFALEIYATLFPHYGGKDGGWAEGPFYASTYTKWYLPFFLAVERATGFTFLNKPFYRRVSQFFMHFCQPGQEVHAFCDGHWDTHLEWPGFQAQDPFALYAERFGPQLARDFARQSLQNIDYFRLHLLDQFLPPMPHQDDGAAGPAENFHVFPDTGFVSMHTDLAHPSRDIAVFARCSKWGSASHQHADQGNFAILIGGRGFIHPTGSFGYRYGEPHHREWTQQTIAQNCFLIDGVGQQNFSADAFGRLLSYGSEGNRSQVVMDLSPAYPALTRAERTLVFTACSEDTAILELRDIIEAEHPVALDWRLHSYTAKPEQDGEFLLLKRETGTVRFQIHETPESYWMNDRYQFPLDGPDLSPSVQRELPTQYHLNWHFAPATRHIITATFLIHLS